MGLNTPLKHESEGAGPRVSHLHLIGFDIDQLHELLDAVKVVQP